MKWVLSENKAMMNKRNFFIVLILVYLLTNLSTVFAANPSEIQSKEFLNNILLTLSILFVFLFFGGAILIIIAASLQTRKILLSYKDLSIEKIKEIEEQRKKAVLKTLKIFTIGELIIILILIVLFGILWYLNIER
ncbi:MAG: hypothetical protein HY776_01345 [Actinobacteria bacterium]|nr:hypothetical protein [Actinomycetota bacterium]